MAKLIPGKIRTEGMALYQQGKVVIMDRKEDLLFARVGNENLRYSLEDEVVFCACDFFQKKKYCVHLAALEYYLKNDDNGKLILTKMENHESDSQEVQTRVSFGSLFLDAILPKKVKSPRFQLSALGQEDDLTGQFIWTLRISRLPDERSYVVRDIRAFLDAVRKEQHYQIGKSYYEPLTFSAFDEPSQELLVYLWGLTRDNDRSEFVFINQGRHLAFPASLFEEGVTRLANLSDFCLEHSMYDYPEVFFQDLHEEAGLFRFEVTEQEPFFELTIIESIYKVLYGGEFLFYNGTFYQLSQEQQQILHAILELPIDSNRVKVLQFDRLEQAKLASGILEFRKMGQVVAPDNLRIHDFKAYFNLDLAETGEVLLTISFDYGQQQVNNFDDLAKLPFASHYEHQEALFRMIQEAGFTPDFETSRPPLKTNDIYPFFQQTLTNFAQLAEVHVSDRLQELYHVEQPTVALHSDSGLLSIGFEFASVEQSEIDEALAALFNAQDYYISKSGNILIFDEETKKVSETLKKLRVRPSKNGQFKTNKLAAYQLSEIFAGKEQVHFSEEFRHLAYDLTHPEDFILPKIQVKAKLRDYQEIGVKWLSMLNHYGFGGILADDMGLGKTLQTIAFLSSQLTEKKRALILAPSSLVYNWASECAKFAPQLDVTVVYGTKDLRDKLITENHQVLITSYASFRQDVEEYRERSFDFLFLDEAQVMKNAQTKIAQYLRNFDVKHTFALSGTPIENHLGEIWSIFQIVLPGLLPSKKDFLKMPAETVARFVKPFIMRRRKEDVLQELPDLTEIVYHNELVDSQKAIYLAQLGQMQERVLTSSDEELNRSKVEILSGLMRLRQICDTPALFIEDYNDESGKLESLRQLLEQVKDSEHRVLIFSQFRGMLDLVEQTLANLEMKSFKITGSTPARERQDMTTAFNNGEGDAFLISLKAGGVGLNLTGADTVILVDLWWNPAVEAQAIGRAHRMGQERNVKVYRLITCGTIEEKIQELQESKRNLVSTVLDGKESRASLTIEDIREILGIGLES